MKLPNKTWKILIIAIIFTLGSGVCYWYMFKTILSKNEHVAELSNDIEALVQKEGQLESIKAKVATTVATREKIETYLIPKEGIVPFLNSIQALGVRNSLTLKVISVDIEKPAVSPDLFEVVKVNLEAIGSWSNVYRFTALLELMPYKILINHADLEKAGAGGFGGATGKQASSGSWKASVVMGVLKIK